MGRTHNQIQRPTLPDEVFDSAQFAPELIPETHDNPSHPTAVANPGLSLSEGSPGIDEKGVDGLRGNEKFWIERNFR
jgi:hypothetical protein